MMTNHITTGN